MKNLYAAILSLTFAAAPAALADTPPAAAPAAAPASAEAPAPAATEAKPKPTFRAAAGDLHQQLQDSVEELTKFREQVTAEKLPLTRKLSDLEGELLKLRQEFQQTSRLLDSRTLDLTNLRNEIKSRNDEVHYVSNLLSEYIRNFESGLHIADLQRYRHQLDAAKLAAENTSLSQQQVLEEQAKLVSVSLDRLLDALGGARFDGSAVDPTGLVKTGSFVMIGPVGVFASSDGQNVGTAEQRLGSLEPAVIAFGDPLDAAAAKKLATTGVGEFPLDPTRGNAHKVEAIQETLWEHIKKGGPVMWPIFILAGAALLVALYKWLTIVFVRRPSRKQFKLLLTEIASRDTDAAMEVAKRIAGPTGRMLRAGVEHLREPRELIEEVMFEQVLTTRLRLNSMLPFIAISASAAPLLGLLGTVTGIMNTFSLMTVFGTGDVKTLSSGISEALITTEYGLIVAIPSLLLHAYLSRKARAVIDDMEKAAVAFLNQYTKTAVSPQPLEQAA